MAAAVDITPWIGIGISILTVLGGSAVNLFIIGRFIGRSDEAMKNVASTLEKVEGRVEEVAVLADKVPLLDQRLTATEVAVAAVAGMKEQITRLTTTIEIDGKHSREKLEGVSRSISVIERQLANLVTTRAGFTTLTSDETNR
jgi:hypothetical protein